MQAAAWEVWGAWPAPVRPSATIGQLKASGRASAEFTHLTFESVLSSRAGLLGMMMGRMGGGGMFGGGGYGMGGGNMFGGENSAA